MPKAKNLKYLRTKNKMTQASLADALGVSVVTISGWESKRHAIPVKAAQRIAKHFKVPYDDFCDYDLEATDKEFAKHPPTKEEVEMIFMLRDMPKEFQDKVLEAVKALYELSNVAHKKRGK